MRLSMTLFLLGSMPVYRMATTTYLLLLLRLLSTRNISNLNLRLILPTNHLSMCVFFIIVF